MKKINRRNFLETSVILSSSAFVFSACSSLGISFRSTDLDIMIINGVIIDGSGKNEFKDDVGIKNGKIAALGNLKNLTAEKIIDAKGMKITPGFIDIHTHTDLGVLRNTKGESKIRQGVTTEVSGNCGSSYGPVSQIDFEKEAKNLDEKFGLVLKNPSLGGFLNMLEDWKFSVNQATLVGLGNIRENIIGMNDRPATIDEIKLMRYEIEKAIDDGAVGAASGLEYTPGSFASTEELIEVCKGLHGIGNLYTTHMRNEDNYVEEAVVEAINISRGANCRLELSHLKASGKSNWYKADKLLEQLDKAVESGMEVHADRYPYVAYHTGLANLFPLWARDGGSKDFIGRMNDQSNYDKMREYAEKKVGNLDGGWDGVVISGLAGDDLQHFKGQSIKSISENIDKEPFDVTAVLIKYSNNSVQMVGFGMNEKEIETILSHPRVMIASDAGAHAPYPPMNKSIAHPRAYGTFPRAIAKYVKERKICSLEEMVRKMTGLPAEKFRLKDRGLIQENKAADIVVFDYEKIKDKAEFTDSMQYPEGINFVIVNGKVVIENGEHTGELPGKIIRF